MGGGADLPGGVCLQVGLPTGGSASRGLPTGRLPTVGSASGRSVCLQGGLPTWGSGRPPPSPGIGKMGGMHPTGMLSRFLLLHLLEQRIVRISTQTL